VVFVGPVGAVVVLCVFMVWLCCTNMVFWVVVIRIAVRGGSGRIYKSGKKKPAFNGRLSLLHFR
jgi:hypothetical protein